MKIIELQVAWELSELYYEVTFEEGGFISYKFDTEEDAVSYLKKHYLTSSQPYGKPILSKVTVETKVLG